VSARDIFVVGLSHRTAPLELRERLAVPAEQLIEDLRALIATGAVDETVVISTCNRVEVYAATSDVTVGARAARHWLAGRAKPDVLDAHLYERAGGDAVHHAFRVAASLDSMVLGEPQILGQVKEAFVAAEGAGTTGAMLTRCFQKAFAVAKRVRTETGIAAGSVSVSSIACELAAKVFGKLEGRRVLLVGAGEMAEAAAKHLRAEGARLVVLNRSLERAQALAKTYEGEARGFDDLAAELALADVVISSTASPTFVINREMMLSVIKARRHRLMLLVDIAVPRDIDPRVGDLENLFLYDVDQLESVSRGAVDARRKEADAAERIVHGEVAEFETWRKSLELTPTIIALRTRFREVVMAELSRTAPRLRSLSDEDRKSLERMGDAMVNKLLHQPLTELKKGVEADSGPQLLDAVRRLFDLDSSEPTAPPSASVKAVNVQSLSVPADAARVVAKRDT